jgi:hypothetical protein
MAPGGPAGPLGGNGRADGLLDAGGAAGGGVGRGGAGGGVEAARGGGGGADAGRTGGLVERLPSDFAGEFGGRVARDDAGATGATEPVRAVLAMLGATHRASGVRYH